MNTKEQYKHDQSVRKQELKELASEIKTLKLDLKDSQRKTSHCLREWNLHRDLGRDKNNTANVINMIYDLYIKSLHAMWRKQYRLTAIRDEYRYKHLIYCLYRGTPEEKIEPNRNEYMFIMGSYPYRDGIRQAKQSAGEYQESKEVELDKAISRLTDEPEPCIV